MSDFHSGRMVSRVVGALLIFALAYLAFGVAFHYAWKNGRDVCREARAARGEFVEPEVFGGFLGLAFDAAFWPVYAWANWYHFGTPLSTPCAY